MTMTEQIEDILSQLPGGRNNYWLSFMPIDSVAHGHGWSVRICLRRNDRTFEKAIAKTAEEALQAAFKKAKLRAPAKSEPSRRLSKKEQARRDGHAILCKECGEHDEPHKHCRRSGCRRWTDGVNKACDDCLLADSRRGT